LLNAMVFTCSIPAAQTNVTPLTNDIRRGGTLYHRTDDWQPAYALPNTKLFHLRVVEKPVENRDTYILSPPTLLKIN